MMTYGTSHFSKKLLAIASLNKVLCCSDLIEKYMTAIHKANIPYNNIKQAVWIPTQSTAMPNITGKVTPPKAPIVATVPPTLPI